MKKTMAVIAALALAVCMIATASAETVKPNPATIDINNLENRMVRTDVEYKNGKLELTLFEPERFATDAIKALKAGDAILTDGEEVTIETIDQDGPDTIFNKGTASEMLFCDTDKGYMEHVEENDMVPWIKLGTMEKEILEYYPILDWIDPITGETLQEVTVYRGDKLEQLLKDPQAIGFSNKNVDIVYDGNNEISLMIRYYSPAQ